MIAEALSLADLITENTRLKNENTYLKEQLEWLKKQVFGQRSEKFVDSLNENQPYLSGLEPAQNQEPEKKKIIPAHERR